MLFEKIRKRWADHKHCRFLDEKGWTELQYQRFTDPGFNRGASAIVDKYPAYPYLKIFPPADMWEKYGDWMVGLTELTKYCEENCTGKWRDDVFLAEQRELVKPDGLAWVDCCLGSDEILVFAFEKEEDCLMFSLRF